MDTEGFVPHPTPDGTSSGGFSTEAPVSEATGGSGFLEGSGEVGNSEGIGEVSAHVDVARASHGVRGGTGISSTSVRNPVSRPVFNELPLPPPESGEVLDYTDEDEERLAPLEIKTSLGLNYFLKLVDIETGEPVVAMFIRGGRTEKIYVPLGTYEVKYASGLQWYGYEHLFGPDTQYMKADEPFIFQRTGNVVSGYTITLYSVPGGTLKPKSISKKDFEQDLTR